MSVAAQEGDLDHRVGSIASTISCRFPCTRGMIYFTGQKVNLNDQKEVNEREEIQLYTCKISVYYLDF